MSEAQVENADPVRSPVDLLADLLLALSVVFDEDWDHTESCLQEENVKFFIAAGGTFLNPDIPESEWPNNWWNRAPLLHIFREAVACCIAHGRKDPTSRCIDG